MWTIGRPPRSRPTIRSRPWATAWPACWPSAATRGDLQHLFVSTMPRAQQTANAISARFPGLPRLNMPEFCESNVDDLADFDGPPPPENMNAWEDAHFSHANLRTWERVARGWEQMHQVIAEKGLERVAVVSHGGAINIMVRLFLGPGGRYPPAPRLVRDRLDRHFVPALRHAIRRRRPLRALAQRRPPHRSPARGIGAMGNAHPPRLRRRRPLEPLERGRHTSTAQHKRIASRTGPGNSVP